MTLRPIGCPACAVVVGHAVGFVLCLALRHAPARADEGGTPQAAPDASADSDAAPQTAACSCETQTGEGARRIHLCTGSLSRERCNEFSCAGVEARKARCDADSPVQLCCDMPGRSLYAYLYEDCVHPNCETGFRAQCQDFGGELVRGACGRPSGTRPKPVVPDGASACSVPGSRRLAGSANACVSLGLLALCLSARRGRRDFRPTAGP